MGRRDFRIVLIKPSHYDADGYVIQWWRSTIPSNSLASVYGLLAECADATACSGPMSTSRSKPMTSATPIIDVKRHRRADQGGRRRLRRPGRRAVEPVPARARSRAAVPRRRHAGGDRRLPCQRLHLDAAGAAGRPAGSARARRHALRRRERRPHGRAAARHRRRRRRSRSTITCTTCRSMAAATLPILPREIVTRVAGHYTSFDAGRGCPFQCSFCTIINVQGRKSRYRTPDDVEAIVRANAAQGITRFFVTDDNFARNKNWEPILDRLIELREKRGLQDPPAPAGRHALPPHSGLHREGGARRLQRGVHRAGEHQSRIADGHQEAPEQDLGIPRDAAGLAQRQGDDLGRLHPRLPDRHAGDRSRATSRSSRRNCRSTSSSSSA